MYDKTRSLSLLPGVDHAYLFALSKLSVLGYPPAQVRYRFMGVPFANPAQCLNIFGRPFYDFEQYRLDLNPTIDNMNQNFGPSIDISIIKPEKLESHTVLNIDPLQNVFSYSSSALPGKFSSVGLTLGTAFTWYDKAIRILEGKNQRFPHYHNFTGAVYFHPKPSTNLSFNYSYINDGLSLNLNDATISSKGKKYFSLVNLKHIFNNKSFMHLTIAKSYDAFSFYGKESTYHNYTDTTIASTVLSASLKSYFANFTYWVNNLTFGASFLSERGWQNLSQSSSKYQNARVKNFHVFYQYDWRFKSPFHLEIGVS